MALTATQLEAAVVRAGTRFTDFERRMGQYGALRVAKENTTGLISQKKVDEVMVSKRRPWSIPVLNKYDPTLLTSRECDFDTDDTTSAKVPLAWFTVGFAISNCPSYLEDNDISEQENIDHQMYYGLNKVFNTLDQAVVTFVGANKQPTLPATPLFTQPTTPNGAYQGETKNFYMRSPGAMARLNLPGPYIDLCNVENVATQIYLQSFGKDNQQNLSGTTGALPSAGQFEFATTNNLSPAGAVAETHYLIPKGSLGILQYLTSDERNKRRVHEGKFWGTKKDDIFGFNWGTYYLADCIDFSADYGPEYKGAFGEKIRFVADFALVKPYSSDATRPYVKYELALSNTSNPA